MNGSKLQGLKVLVIDDSKTIRRTAETLLAKEGCEVFTAIDGFDALAKYEGILPALESSHAVAAAIELAAGRPCEQAIVVCLSGRGDKDAAEIARIEGEKAN